MSLYELSIICRLYVCVALACSALGKALTFGDFQESLSESFHIDARTAKYEGAALIWIEALNAVVLLSGGMWARAGAVIGAGLFLVLAGAIAWAMMRGSALVCNCFGRSREPMSYHELARNLLFAAASTLYAFTPASTGSLDPTAYALLLAIAVIAFLVSVHLRDIAFLLR